MTLLSARSYNQKPLERSPQSLALEEVWRGLERTDGLVPKRSAFRPELAPRLLTNLALLDVYNGETITTRVRLVGSRLRDLANMDVTGIDYLDLVPDRAYQAEHLRLCVETPCASWAVSPVVYERGYNSLVEITHFPLTDEKTGGHIGMVLIYEMGCELPEFRSIGKPIEMKPAMAKKFIDIGAGVPL